MDPVEVHQTTTGTGRAELVADDPVDTPARAPQRVSAVAPTRGYAETRVVNPVWRRISQLVWLVVGIMDAVLAMDFLFRALSAGNTGFANFIYNLGGALGAPFDGIFGNTVNNAGAGTIGIDRWGDLVAIVVYSLIAAAIVQLVRILTTPKDSVASSSTTVL